MVGGGPLLYRSLVGSLAPKLAPSRMALFNSCFKLKAPPKSKIATTRTTRSGRATANSMSAAASVLRSADRFRQSRAASLSWLNTRLIFSRHLHARVEHYFLHIQRSKRKIK